MTKGELEHAPRRGGKPPGVNSAIRIAEQGKERRKGEETTSDKKPKKPRWRGLLR